VGRYLRVDPVALAGGTNLFSYVFNDPVSGIDPQGLKTTCIPWIAWKSAWKEAWSYETDWKLTGKNVILTGVSGSCHWTKYKKGVKERKITERELCLECKCDSKRLYIKEGKTHTDTKSFKDVIDTDITPIRWIKPVGGYSWVYTCDRNYRSPFLPDKD